jgi:hypothetical protein
MVATLVMALANVVSGHAVCPKLTTLKRFPLVDCDARIAAAIPMAAHAAR